MKTVCSLISFPITLLVSITCFLFVVIFDFTSQTKEGISAVERMIITSRTLLLKETWDKTSHIFKAIISLVVYYLIFF